MNNPITLTNEFAETEVQDAKEFWRSTASMGLTYGATVPNYARVVSEAIASTKPKSVFEFGCNGGRNLKLIGDLSPTTKLSGTDINATSIEFAKKERELDVILGDENTLSNIADDAWDISFTISVLDHVPYWKPIATELLRISKRYLFLHEPFEAGRAGRIEGTKDLKTEPSTKDTVVAYSYLHDYMELKEHATLVFDRPVPVKPGGVGPLYRLMVFSKQKEDPNEFARTLNDAVEFKAI